MPDSILIVSYKSSKVMMLAEEIILLISPRVGITLDARARTITWKKNRLKKFAIITLITTKVMEKIVIVRTFNHSLRYQKGKLNLRKSAIQRLLLHLYFNFALRIPHDCLFSLLLKSSLANCIIWDFLPSRMSAKQTKKVSGKQHVVSMGLPSLLSPYLKNL